MTMRLTGLSSGMDTNKLISSIMQVEKIPMLRLKAENEFKEDKIKAWNDISGKMSELNTKANDLNSYLNWKNVKSISNNEAVAQITATHDALDASYNITVKQLATSHRVGSNAQTDISTSLGHSGSFSIGGQSVTLDGTENIKQIAEKINTAAKTMTDKVQASVVDTTLVIQRKDTGNQQISFDDPDGILKNLGILNTDNSIKNEFVKAQDMQMTVSGIDIKRSANQNLKDIIHGVTINVSKAGDTVIGVKRDTDSVKEKINDFIKSYNDTMALLEEKTKIELASGGDKVKSTGLLQGESAIRSIQTKARSLLNNNSSGLNASFDSLRKIGISFSGRENRLSITNSSKLDNALKNNMTEVEDLFRDYDHGILRKFSSQMKVWTNPADGVVNTRKNSLQKQIKSNTERIAHLERRLTLYETSLANQFARMEEAMSKMKGQQEYLNNLFNTGSSSKDKK